MRTRLRRLERLAGRVGLDALGPIPYRLIDLETGEYVEPDEGELALDARIAELMSRASRKGPGR